MVEMKLIKTDNEKSMAYFHCLPELDENQAFDLEVDFENKKINFCSIKQNVYVAHAAWKVYDIFEETGKIPEKATAIWV